MAGVFDSKLVNAADTVAFVVDAAAEAAAVAAAAAVDVEFAGKIAALIDWTVAKELMLFGVEAIFRVFFTIFEFLFNCFFFLLSYLNSK